MNVCVIHTVCIYIDISLIAVGTGRKLFTQNEQNKSKRYTHTHTLTQNPPPSRANHFEICTLNEAIVQQPALRHHHSPFQIMLINNMTRLTREFQIYIIQIQICMVHSLFFSSVSKYPVHI